MTAFTFTVHASNYGAETFRPGAFDRTVGKTIPVNVETSRTRQGTVVSADVAEDGATARLTVEVADMPLPNRLGAVSIGYNLPADGVNEEPRLIAQRQRALAATGDAANQCPHCGSYRTDELPPILHARDCPDRDAWKDNPLQYVDTSPIRQALPEVAYAPRLMACGAWHEHPAHNGCLGVRKGDAFARFMRGEEPDRGN